MFGKLLKYEFKSVGKWYFGLYGLTLLLSFIIAIWIRSLAVRPDSSITDIEGWTFMSILFAFIVLLVGLFLSTFFMIFNRFRKNVYGREGYLTMTLPVTSHEIILSKLLAAVIWSALAFIVAIISICIIAIFLLNTEIIKSQLGEFDFIFKAWIALYDIQDVFGFIRYLFYQLANTISGILLVYFCISIGQLFKDHRLLFSILSYVGISFIFNMFSFIFGFTVGNQTAFSNPTDFDAGLFYFIVDIFLAVAYYFGTHYILTKKLNLQ